MSCVSCAGVLAAAAAAASRSRRPGEEGEGITRAQAGGAKRRLVRVEGHRRSAAAAAGVDGHEEGSLCGVWLVALVQTEQHSEQIATTAAAPLAHALCCCCWLFSLCRRCMRPELVTTDACGIEIRDAGAIRAIAPKIIAAPGKQGWITEFSKRSPHVNALIPVENTSIICFEG